MAAVKFKPLDPDKIRIDYDELLNETESAYYIQFDDDNSHWIPKSLCAIHEQDNEIDIIEWKYNQIFA